MSADNSYLAYTVYENLKKCITYRNLELVGIINYDDHKKINTDVDYDKFVNDIIYYGYVMLECRDAKNKDRRFTKNISDINKKRPVKTFILLLDVKSQYVQSSNNLMKLLNRVPGFNDSKRNYNTEILLVTKDSINIHLGKKITSSVFTGDDEAGYIIIYPYEYMVFLSERPQHILIAPHRIIPRTEEKKILAELHTTKKDLPKLRKNEVMGIWLGAEIGDMIEVQLPSEISGIQISYLVVRP